VAACIYKYFENHDGQRKLKFFLFINNSYHWLQIIIKIVEKLLILNTVEKKFESNRADHFNGQRRSLSELVIILQTLRLKTEHFKNLYFNSSVC